jgi:deazaflavin-dependent oxidoreductase (nitroreductase family)
MAEYKKPDIALYGKEHIEQYEATDGEVGYRWNGAPCLVLTTTGAKTGEARKHALICNFDGDRVVVVASYGGAPEDPQWYRNLVAHPQVRVQVQADKYDAVARTATGDERERLWNLMTEVWPNYDDYAKRTSRVIPVVVLQRAA